MAHHDRDWDALDLIVDPVGGELREASLEALNPGGRLLIVGHASPNPDEPLQADPTRAKPALDAVASLVTDGTLSVPAQTLPLAGAAVAHQHLQDQSNTGRLVLTTG